MLSGSNGKVQAVENQAVTALDTYVLKDEERGMAHRGGIPESNIGRRDSDDYGALAAILIPLDGGTGVWVWRFVSKLVGRLK